MSGEYTLYDLSGKEDVHRAWSVNPWKSRLVLNFKGLPYKTEWVALPDVHETLKATGVTPNEGGATAYTVPTVRLPSGEYVMESWKIAQRIEADSPTTPSLHLDSAEMALVKAEFDQIWSQFAVLAAAYVPPNFFTQSTLDWFRNERLPRVGKSYDDLRAAGESDEPWNGMAPHVQKLAAALKEKSNEGPFFMGKTPSYADLLWVALVLFAKACGKATFDRLMAFDDVLKTHFEACKPWYQKDT